MGRRLFDVVDGPHGWRDDLGYGAERDQSAAPPCFVLTHRPPAGIRLRTPSFFFVTEGIERAVELARAAAGERDVVVMGGADVCAQCVAAGLAEEIRIHLAPVLLGGGIRLFEHLGGPPRRLRIAEVTESPRATHLRYQVGGEARP